MSSSNDNHKDASSSRMTVHLTVTAAAGSPRVALDLPDNCDQMTSAQLRDKISQVTHIPLSHLKVIYRGRLIPSQDTDCVVSEFRLEHDSVLHCLGKPQPPASSATIAEAAATASPTPSAATFSDPSSSAVPVPPTLAAAAPATTVAAPSSTATTTATTTSSSSSLTAALDRMRRAVASPARYGTALQTLVKLLDNIVQHPLEEKYRRIKSTNAAFAKRLGQVPHGTDVLQAVGFALQPHETPPTYVLHASPQAWPQVLDHQATLQQALTKHEQEQQAATVPPPVPPMGSSSSAMANPFLSSSLVGAGAGGGLDPAAASNLASQFLSNPEALQAMLQNPMVQEQMRHHPQMAQLEPMIQQLSSNPAMMQQMAQLMQSPQLQAQLQQHLQQQQQTMSGGGGGPAMPNFLPPNIHTAPPSSSTAATTNNSNATTNNSNTSSGQSDNELTEEEMIAEAIRRSLQDQS